MFIKKTAKRYKDRVYTNHLLVESISTPNGPRHKIWCSLGSLEPAPRAEWLGLARKIEAALGGQPGLEPDARVDAIVERVRSKGKARRADEPAQAAGAHDTDLISVHTDRVATEDVREAGPVHVGHQMWLRLGLNGILAAARLPAKARLLAEVMTLNRLVDPLSEHAAVDWVQRVALSDVIATDLSTLNDEALYRNLDRLHPHRAAIEKGLAERERTLFNLDGSVYLYDLTSTYFEGQCMRNAQAKRGYSRDKRPDCMQVVIGLVLDGDGFPKAHEVFDGNRTDHTTVVDMLTKLEERVGRTAGATVVVDRGMAFDRNLQEIKDRGYHYIVAARQGERDQHLADYENEADWVEIIREPSPRNMGQKKTPVYVAQRVAGEEVHVLCRSDGRKAKDRAIREKREGRFLVDLEKLQQRIAARRLVDDEKINQAIGRLRERHSSVGRYYDIAYDRETQSLSWQVDSESKCKAEQLDGSYLLKTDRQDLTEEEIWHTYMLLTRVESAFRSMKSPLMERPINHQLQHRVQAHIFLCVLAYHLLVGIEKMFLDRGVHTSWGTLREQLSTHQVMTVVLPTSDGSTLRIRRGSKPEPVHQEIYKTLGIPGEAMTPVRTWTPYTVTENEPA